MKLYANREIRRTLPAEVKCGTFSVRSNKPAPFNLDALPDLDVTACTNEDGSVITVFMVNRSLEEVKVELKLEGAEPLGDALLYEITGDSFEEINSVFEPERITCRKRVLPAEAWQQGYPLRPTSVYALELKTKQV